MFMRRVCVPRLRVIKLFSALRLRSDNAAELVQESVTGDTTLDQSATFLFMSGEIDFAWRKVSELERTGKIPSAELFNAITNSYEAMNCVSGIQMNINKMKACKVPVPISHYISLICCHIKSGKPTVPFINSLCKNQTADEKIEFSSRECARISKAFLQDGLNEFEEWFKLVESWYPGSRKSPIFSDVILIYYCKIGDIEKAEKSYSHLFGLGFLQVEALCDMYINAGRLDKALDIFHKLRSRRKNSYFSALQRIIQQLVTDGKLDYADNLLLQCPPERIFRSIFILIEGYLAVGNVERASFWTQSLSKKSHFIPTQLQQTLDANGISINAQPGSDVLQLGSSKQEISNSLASFFDLSDSEPSPKE